MRTAMSRLDKLKRGKGAVKGGGEARGNRSADGVMGTAAVPRQDGGFAAGMHGYIVFSPRHEWRHGRVA